MGHGPWGHEEPGLTWQQLNTHAQEGEGSLNGPASPSVRNAKSLSRADSGGSSPR